MPAIPRWTAQTALLLLLLLLVGCRRPEPVVDRFPGPVSTRDMVRAEQRTSELDEAERLTVETLLDRYHEQFVQLRETEIAAFLQELREAEGSEPDLEDLRRRVGRHRAIFDRIGAFDQELFAQLADALGSGRSGFLTVLASRRALDRANAVVMADGGRVLIDLRGFVDSLGFTAASRASIESSLLEHEEQAAPLALAVAEAQMRLPIAYQDVLRRLGPPERDLEHARFSDDDARNRARGRAEQRRFAAARRDLEVVLHRHAELVDRSAEAMASALPAEEASLLRRRMLRLRIDDEMGRLADTLAFDALVASRAQGVPVATQARIAAIRERFLAEEEVRMRRWWDEWKALKVPGELSVGGEEAQRERSRARAAIERDRAQAATRFREEVMALVPPDVKVAIEGLRSKNRDEFSTRLAEIVGGGRVANLVARRPRGYGDHEPPHPEPPQREADQNELRFLLPAPPDARDWARFIDRAQLDEGSRAILQDVASAWRERWDASAAAAIQRIQPLMQMMRGAGEAGPDEFDRTLQRVIAVVDEVRAERRILDRELKEDLSAAGIPLDGAAGALWGMEREELARRLQWHDMLANDQFPYPPEALVPLMDIIARTELSPGSTIAVATALRDYTEELDSAGDALQRETLHAVRRLAVLAMEARTRGQEEEGALSANRPETRRARAAAVDAAERLARAHGDALAACVAALPPVEARRLREGFVRSAYETIVDLGQAAARAIDGVANDRSLDDAQLSAVREIIEQRERARDEAIGRLLVWAREYRGNLRAFRRGQDAGRAHPEVAIAAFARDEADARAVRAAWGVLRADQRERHRDLDAWFVDGVRPIRNYD